MAEEPSSMVDECRALLAGYLRGLSHVPARWYPVIQDINNNFASLLGLDYNVRYIPMLLKCGLVKKRMMKNGNFSYVLSLTSSRKGYLWSAFFAQYSLHNIELTQSFIQSFNQKIFFICIGSFDVKPFYGKRFTPIEQHQEKLDVPLIRGISQKKVSFCKKLAVALPIDMLLTSEEDEGEEEEPRKPTSQPKNIQSEKYTEQQQLNIKNFKLIIKNSYFAPIL